MKRMAGSTSTSSLAGEDQAAGSATSKGKSPSTEYEEDADNASSASSSKQTPYRSTGIKDEYSPTTTKAKKTRQRNPRTVLKLTAAQLERKRANDREAQRALRQRTKEHIEYLERRIDALSKRHTQSEVLGRMQRRNQELTEQLERVRASMAQLQLQTIQAAPSTTSFQGNFVPEAQEEMAASQYHATTADATNLVVLPSVETSSLDYSTRSNQYFDNHQLVYNDLAMRTTNTAPVDPYNTTYQWDPEQVDIFMDEDDGGAKAYWTELPWVSQSFESMGGATYMPEYARFPTSEKMPFTFDSGIYLSEPSMVMGSMDSRGFLNIVQERAAPALPLSMPTTPPPVWARVPLYFTSNNPLDLLLRDCMETHWASDDPLPGEPDFGALFAPRLPPSKTDLLNDALVTCIRLCACESIVTEAALFYTSHALWRWFIYPSPATYARLPVYMRPVRRQLEIPHPQWTNAVFFPLLRDRMQAEQERYHTIPFIISFTESFDVVWPRPRPDGTSAIFTVAEDGRVVLSAPFEAAVRDLRCWTMHEKFFKKFPECRELVQVHTL